MTVSTFAFQGGSSAVVTPLADTCQTIIQLPKCVNLEIYEGDDIWIDMTVTDPVTSLPIDLTGADVQAQIRASVDADSVLAEFEGSVDPTTTNLIHLHLPSEDNTGMPTDAVWDCQIDLSGITTLAAGTVKITQEVTRPVEPV